MGNWGSLLFWGSIVFSPLTASVNFFNKSMKESASRVAQILFNLYLDENGQSTVEYIVILAATVVGASALGRQILKSLDAGVLRLGGQLEQDLKTGRAPLNVWQN